MSTHSAGRTPAGYPVVEVEQGAGSEHTGLENGQPFLSRVRSVKLNGWEVALWVIAVVLVVASIQMSVYATQHLYMGNYSSECDSDGVCTSPASLVYLQAGMSLSPAGLASGLFSAIVAIAVRALNVAARRRTATEAAAVAHTAPSSMMPVNLSGTSERCQTRSRRRAEPLHRHLPPRRFPPIPPHRPRALRPHW
jgi:hypothetical protein